MAVANGFEANLGIDTANPTTQAFQFARSGVSKSSELIVPDGIRGLRSRDHDRAKIINERVSGNLTLYPSVTETDALLLWLLGATSTGTSTFTEDLKERYIQVDKVTKVYTYDECVPARWQISGQAGQPLEWSIEVEGKSEAEGNAGTFPSLSYDEDTSFFTFNEVTLTLNGITCTPFRFTLSVDNSVSSDRFLNAINRSEIPANDRIVNLTVELPFDSVHEPLYDTAAAGYAGTLAWSDGSTTYTWTLTNCKAAESPIEVPGRSEIVMPLNLQIFGDHSASNDELICVKS